VQPHKVYNWYTAELINFKKSDSSIEQGVFYKPENFDLNKKYPVIIHYYERMSPTVYNYIYPSFSNGSIDIPYFVSNGYLVFSADITYAAGRPGSSAYTSIIGAAAYLSRLKYVDSTRLAISGASFGGFETNYIITHSNIFAAAAEGCGVSNLVSFYGLLGGRPGSEHESNQKKVEWGQYRMGGTIWEKPEAYIDNSPIFNLHRVTTPLLMMHNRSDDQVPWYQAIELFTGLRRLHKKVWMLEYDKGTHGVRGKDAIDYTIRLKQFMDYYLKNAPPPKWMTQGIPASKKGIFNGFEFDSPDSIP
jgi:dipeptidyl aminopeptidase/acylaminoacyl peptidase